VNTLDALSLTRLLQLASPALPVGAYSYSGGLESAIEDGLVTDADSAAAWITDVLEYSVASFEAPLLWHMSCALADDHFEAFLRWNAVFKAGRETAELRAETLQMGNALKILLAALPYCDEAALAKLDAAGGLTFPAAFSFSAHCMKLDAGAALIAYLWSWLENQVMAALKALPVGQTAGQNMLAAIGARLPQIAQKAMTIADDELSNFAPGLAIASSRHEIQYSRLFRS
jgi:urease accessory protein